MLCSIRLLELGAFLIYISIESVFIDAGKMQAWVCPPPFCFLFFFFFLTSSFFKMVPNVNFLLFLSQIPQSRSRANIVQQVIYSVDCSYLSVHIPFECCVIEGTSVSDLALTSLVRALPDPLLSKRSTGGLGKPFSTSLQSRSSESGNLGF